MASPLSRIGTGRASPAVVLVYICKLLPFRFIVNPGRYVQKLLDSLSYRS